MTDIQSIFASRTVWANAIGLLAIALAFFGIDIGADDANRLVEASLQVVTACSILASTVFRIIATRRIARA
jgi:hypothetical protein